jgi:hypothetical protein
MRCEYVVLLVAACGTKEPVEKVRPAPALLDAGLALERISHPPESPPPPEPPGPPGFGVPPPKQLFTFVLTQGAAPDPWRVTMYKLDTHKEGGERFMDAAVLARFELPPPRALELVMYLVSPVAFEGGVYG